MRAGIGPLTGRTADIMSSHRFSAPLQMTRLGALDIDLLILAGKIKPMVSGVGESWWGNDL
jgi:hypothetical protein